MKENDMMENEKRAVDFMREGKNCSQSVLMAFCKECDIDTETASAISSAFGGGLARQHEVCGAISGMCMAAGLVIRKRYKENPKTNSEVYKIVQGLLKEFKDIYGTMICRELLEKSKDEKRPCEKRVEDCARILREFIERE